MTHQKHNRRNCGLHAISLPHHVKCANQRCPRNRSTSRLQRGYLYAQDIKQFQTSLSAFMVPVPPPVLVTYTLKEFIQKYLAIKAYRDGTPGSKDTQLALAANFALTGIHDGNWQANINCLTNPVEPAEAAEITQIRDFDSLLGFVPGAPRAHCDLLVHPVPDPEHTLKKNIFVKVDFILPGNVSFFCHCRSHPHSDNTLLPNPNPRHSFSALSECPRPAPASRTHILPASRRAPPHHRALRAPETVQTDPTRLSPHLVPNTILANFEPRGRVRAFFPGLFSQGCDVQLAFEHQEAVYLAMRRAIREVGASGVTRWSPSYRSALRKAMKPDRRHFQWSTNLVASENATPFLRAFHHHLTTDNQWAANIVFQFQIQGVKDFYQHNRTTVEARRQLDTLMEPFDPDTGEWFVDVGLDIFKEGVVLQWRTSSHATLLSHILSIDDVQANRACSLHNRNYHRDISAHLPDLSGFRIDLKPNQGGEFDAGYAQFYDSGKYLASHKRGDRVALEMSGHMAMRGDPPVQINDYYEMQRDASKDMCVSARIEFRVPLRNALRILIRALPEWLLNASLLVFSIPAWWSVFLSTISSHHSHVYSSGDGDPSGSTPLARY